jgi:hypothetical protein
VSPFIWLHPQTQDGTINNKHKPPVDCCGINSNANFVFNANRTPISGQEEKKKKYLLAVSMKKKEILVAVPTAVPATTTTSISLFMSLAVDKQY